MVRDDGEFVQNKRISWLLPRYLRDEEVGRGVLEGIWLGALFFVGFGSLVLLLC